MTLALTAFQNQFSNKIPFKCNRKHIEWLWIFSRSILNHHLNNLRCLICLPVMVGWLFLTVSAVCDCGISWSYSLTIFGRPHIPNATYQVPRSLAFWFWRRIFWLVFILRIIYHKKSSHGIWVQLGQWFVSKLWINMKGQRSTLIIETYL